MLDDYQIYKDRDLPKEVWDFIREKGFLGMVIPEKYGERRVAPILFSGEWGVRRNTKQRFIARLGRRRVAL